MDSRLSLCFTYSPREHNPNFLVLCEPQPVAITVYCSKFDFLLAQKNQLMLLGHSLLCDQNPLIAHKSNYLEKCPQESDARTVSAKNHLIHTVSSLQPIQNEVKFKSFLSHWKKNRTFTLDNWPKPSNQCLESFHGSFGYVLIGFLSPWRKSWNSIEFTLSESQIPFERIYFPFYLRFVQISKSPHH